MNDRNLRWAEGRVFVALLRQSCCERMQQDFSASGLGSLPTFAAIFTNDRLALAPSFGRSAALWVRDVTQKSVLLGI